MRRLDNLSLEFIRREGPSRLLQGIHYRTEKLYEWDLSTELTLSQQQRLAQYSPEEFLESGENEAHLFLTEWEEFMNRLEDQGVVTSRDQTE